MLDLAGVTDVESAAQRFIMGESQQTTRYNCGQENARGFRNSIRQRYRSNDCTEDVVHGTDLSSPGTEARLAASTGQMMLPVIT